MFSICFPVLERFEKTLGKPLDGLVHIFRRLYCFYFCKFFYSPILLLRKMRFWFARSAKEDLGVSPRTQTSFLKKAGPKTSKSWTKNFQKLGKNLNYFLKIHSISI